jgi:hypothetical protein
VGKAASAWAIFLVAALLMLLPTIVYADVLLSANSGS